MTMKKYLLLIICAFFISFTYAQSIKWRTFAEVEELRKTNPKPIFIDTYTSWCGWCKRLDAGTFKDPAIVQLINKKFYAIKFNAETLDTLTFKGEKYINRKYRASRPANDLAISLLEGKLSYPSMLLFDKDLQNKHIIAGYKDALSLMSYLLMYQDDSYKTTNVQEFEFFFLETFKKSTLAQNQHSEKINWMSTEDAFSANKKDSSKQILIQLYVEGNSICTVLDSVTLDNTEVIQYINQNYYPVKLNVFSKEKIKIGKNKFENTTGNIHDFVLSLPRSGNIIKVPQTIIIKKEGVLTDRAPQFLNPRLMEVWLHYNADKSKGKVDFKTYAKNFQYKVSYERVKN